MKKGTKKVKKVVVAPYSATIKILGKIYNSTGNSVREAIENLKPTGKSMGNCVLSLSKGEIKVDKIITAFQVYRLFSHSKLMRELALKNTSLLFNL